MVHPDAFLLNDELFQYIFFGNKDQEPRYEKASHHIFGVFSWYCPLVRLGAELHLAKCH